MTICIAAIGTIGKLVGN